VNPTQLIAKCQSHAERERKQGGYCQVSFSQESPPLQATKHHTNYLAIQKKRKKETRPAHTETQKREGDREGYIYLGMDKFPSTMVHPQSLHTLF
jgi:hypothetical protein